MIQELFRGTNVSILGGERSNLSTQILDPAPTSSPSPSSYAVPDNPTTTTPPPAQNLRCPRCDSSNTKFCYYNNYNLTQPRHFCKTCRRYWTKGGALRNVPIGGSFRKNKTSATTSAGGKSSSVPGKPITTEIGKSTLFNGFDQSELPPNPFLWPSTHHFHLLSLLRQNPNPNPSHTPNDVSQKEEGLMFGSSHFTSSGLNERSLGMMDPLGPLQVPSIEPANSYYRNKGILLGEAENNGLQDLYQRLRSSTSSYPEQQAFLGHVAYGGTSNSSAILDSAPVAQSGGFLNPALYWQPNDLRPTSNGAYP